MFDRDELLRDLRVGLAGTPRSIPPKYFYDEHGSRLFDRITELDEYYPTRTERGLLERVAPQIIEIATPCTLVELGAGSASKTVLILDALVAHTPRPTYIPIDISAAYVEEAAIRTRQCYPGLDVQAVVADFAAPFALPSHREPALHAFLGSTIGNFEPERAVPLLRSVRERMRPGDAFLLGTDLQKDTGVLERAYNDAHGITAQFNRNVLAVVNDVLGASIDPAAFAHLARYNQGEHRIEMYLVARSSQTLVIPGLGDVHLAPGERILTEVSYKYDRPTVERLLSDAGLRLTHWFTDDAGYFALSLSIPRQ